MNNRRHAVGVECRNLLETAVQKHLPLSITVHQENNWQVYKSNFLDIHSNRLILAQPTPDLAQCHMEPETGQQMAITFKKGYNKCLFVTRVIGPDRYEIDPGIYMPALVVFKPDQIEKIQRRAYDRANAPTSDPVQVTFWKSDSSDTDKWQGTLTNLSAGGLGLKVNNDPRPSFEESEQFELEFIPLAGQKPIYLQARLRHITQKENEPGYLLGFQILGLEITEEGRNTLRHIGRIVNVYKRQNPIAGHQELLRR